MNRPSLLNEPAQHIQEFWLANSAECPGVRSMDKEVTFLLLSTGKEEKRRMRVYQRPYWELYDDLPADERFEFVELWDAAWRDTGTWEDGSIVRAWLKRTKDRSVEVVVRVSAVVLWDVEVEDAPADAVAQHRRLGHVGRIGVLSALTLDRLASAFSEDDE